MPNYNKYLDKLCVMNDTERAKEFVDDIKQQEATGESRKDYITYGDKKLAEYTA